VATAATTALELKVARVDADLLLTWNRQSLTIREAMFGRLSLVDSEIKKDLMLDREQLLSGQLLYTPVSGDLSFRLEVVTEGRSRVAEALRVVEGAALVGRSTTSAPPPDLTSALRPSVPVDEPPTSSEPLPQSLSGKTWNAPGEKGVVATTIGGTNSQPSAQRVFPRFMPAAIASSRRQPVAVPVITPPDFHLAASPDLPSAIPAGFVLPESPRPLPPAVEAPPSQRSTRGLTPPTVTSAILKGNVMSQVPLHIKQMLKADTLVSIKVKVSKDGKVMTAEAVKSDIPLAGLIAREMIASSKSWRFEPARRDGKAIESETVLSFKFSR
jgi:hypothetical protein